MTIKKEFIVNRQGKDHVLYAGLLDAAHAKGLQGIKTLIVQLPTDLNGHVAVVHATVAGPDGQSYDGVGDADQGNVSRMMVPHLLRMAETRAKARALRDFVNVGAALADDPTDELDPRDVDGETGEITHGKRAEPALDRRGLQQHLDRTDPRTVRQKYAALFERVKRDNLVALPLHSDPQSTDEQMIQEGQRLQAELRSIHGPPPGEAVPAGGR